MSTFRHSAEALRDFPWEHNSQTDGRGVWLGLIQPEQSNISARSSEFNLIDTPYQANFADKQAMLERLLLHRAARLPHRGIKILGIWTGKLTTDLFVFPREEAIAQLERVLRKGGSK